MCGGDDTESRRYTVHCVGLKMYNSLRIFSFFKQKNAELLFKKSYLRVHNAACCLQLLKITFMCTGYFAHKQY